MATSSERLTLTFDQLLTLVREGQKSQGLDAEMVARLASQTAVAAADHTRQWWDESKFPQKSHFNPLGEKDHPRPDLRREILWLGYPLQKSELTRDEIERLNKIEPGNYHLPNPNGTGVQQYNFFIVREKSPGDPNSPIVVFWPCTDPSDRAKTDRYDRGRGMVDLLDSCFLRDLEETAIAV